MNNTCEHISSIKIDDIVPPHSKGCEQCLKMGSDWVYLRLCLTCGHVGCCDNSPNKHATKHAKETKHPVVQTFEPEPIWLYCYEDDMLVDDAAVYYDGNHTTFEG